MKLKHKKGNLQKKRYLLHMIFQYLPEKLKESGRLVPMPGGALNFGLGRDDQRGSCERKVYK